MNGGKSQLSGALWPVSLTHVGHSTWGRACPAYQVVDLMVPPTGHKHHLACLLCDLQWWATVISHGV